MAIKTRLNSDDMSRLFGKHDDEYIRFERVERKRSGRRDLHAFMLLDELAPCDDDGDMIDCARHDIIYLNIDLEALADVITEAQIIELIRCGVMYDSDGLHMFR